MATVATPYMEWKDAWLVGVSELDDQHKKLVSLINQLHEAMRSGQARKIIGDILTELVNYTKGHFAAEERLLSTNGYADFAAHKQEHVKLTAKVLEFQKDFNAGTAALSVDVMHFLSDWLRRHILGTDQKYAPFLSSKGVQ